MKKELTEQQLLLLKSPLPQEAISKHPSMPWLSTVKAIFVTERLNDVFGVGGWRVKTKLLKLSEGTSSKGKPEFTTLVHIQFTVLDYDIYYECIAGSTNLDMGDAAKGGITDSITKIASWLGVGADIFKGLHDDKGYRGSEEVVKKQSPEEKKIEDVLKDLNSTDISDRDGVIAWAQEQDASVRASKAFRLGVNDFIKKLPPNEA